MLGVGLNRTLRTGYDTRILTPQDGIHRGVASYGIDQDNVEGTRQKLKFIVFITDTNNRK